MPAKPPTHRELETLYQEIFPGDGSGRHDDPAEQNRTRMRRALSWLERSAKAEKDEWGERFLFLWIAFNAAYGDDPLQQYGHPGLVSKVSEHAHFKQFLRKITAADKEHAIYAIVWERFNNEFKNLIDSPFLYPAFWKAQYDPEARKNWMPQFKKEKKAVLQGIKSPDNTWKLLLRLFDRLYVLRNQVFHGGATWRSETNPTTLRPGVRILDSLMPVILHIMLKEMQKEPGGEWGTPPFPPVLGDPSQGPAP